MPFKDKLKQLRLEKNLKQEDIAEFLKFSRTTISGYEVGRNEPSYEVLHKLSEFFGVSTDYLLDKTNNRNSILPKDAIRVDGFVKIPVLGVIRAGEPMYAEQNIIDYEYVATLHLPQGECFFLKVVGDSMNLSNIVEGSLVLVRVQEEVENGEIAVVLVNGDDATVKRFYKNGNTVTLMPNSTNQMHQPKVLDTQETNVEIVGKVVQAVIRF